MATPSEIGICNSALSKIGASRITAFDGSSKEAILCDEQYKKLRDDVLRAHPWKFALKRATLQLLPEAPAFGYACKFDLPGDYLRVVRFEPSGCAYTIEGRELLTDASEAAIQYVSLVDDPALFDPNFREALAFRLAADLAYPIAQSAALAKGMMDAYEQQLRLARSMNAQEGTPPKVEADDWIQSRW